MARRRSIRITSCTTSISSGDYIERVTLRDVKAKTTQDVDIDIILPMLGFVSDLGTLKEWGLTLDKDEIVVNSQMETGLPGIYAAGDICTYPGKLKLIATGFAEAATAVNQAVHLVHPDKKVNPGHSSNLAIFGPKGRLARSDRTSSQKGPDLSDIAGPCPKLTG